MTRPTDGIADAARRNPHVDPERVTRYLNLLEHLEKQPWWTPSKYGLGHALSAGAGRKQLTTIKLANRRDP